MRLNGGAWIDLHNANPDLICAEHESAYGCLSGAYHTVRLSVPAEGAVEGLNEIEVRMNQTDGFSNGWRLLAFDVRDARDESLLPARTMVQEDPREWTAPRPSAAEIERGRVLWQTKALRESPLSDSMLKASCSDCHAVDGA